MKKICAWTLSVLVLVFCLAGSAMAEAETDVYDLFAALLNGCELTLTVSAENIDGLEDIIPPYSSMICVVKQENNQILINVSCDSEAYLIAFADEQCVRLETNLLDMESMEFDWDSLMPNFSLTKEEGSCALKISMTGPDRELINFSCKVRGTELTDYQVDIQGGFITGPGAVYGLWDSLGAKQGSSSRDFAITYDESEVLLEATGKEEVSIDEDGCTTITRVEDCTVFQDEEEIGTLTIRSVLRIKK